MNDNKVNILLVDDQPAKLLTYEAMLEELGENLVRASSGKEALEKLLKMDVAVILADVNMPEMDGFELADLIQQHPRFRKTALIFISAVHLSDQDRMKGYQSGAVDYVSVPIVPEVLCAKVKIFVELYRKTQQLVDSEKSLRELSRHLLRSQDEERRRIGRDLHDTLGQNLVAIKMALDSLAELMGPELGEYRKHVNECRSLSEGAIKELRTISHLMYPPMLDELGLRSAVAWYLDGFAQRSEIATTFESPDDFGRLAPDVELAMFRILQESVTNVHRHSGSSMASVRLYLKDGAAHLEVSDRGKGIARGILGNGGTRSLGVGLRGMEERVRQLGGRLKISSSSAGTTVTATIPIADQSRKPQAIGAASKGGITTPL
jgi:signal transduction histidine kinase